jgi:hypothetical protein
VRGRRVRWVVLGVAVAALSACSSSDPGDRDAAPESDVTSTAPDGATSTPGVNDVTLPAVR